MRNTDKVLQEMGKSSGFREHVAKTLLGSDYISRTVIDWARSIPVHDLSDGKGLCRVIFAEDFLKALKDLPSAQPERQWIPCSERLPKYDGEMYLVTDYCEQINRRRIHVSYCYVNREGFWSDVPLGYKVIAWMPLPTPYQEKQDA